MERKEDDETATSRGKKEDAVVDTEEYPLAWEVWTVDLYGEEYHRCTNIVAESPVAPSPHTDGHGSDAENKHVSACPGKTSP
ncbi:hypothetical protein FVEG_15974 [Fusarium verticillioides 7600]|uniref:Uncharacterized protein n=1 Tax=Gibberella moniliformis (strain M3125 / FGSC 7600) TaxID=334819 RepID=W7M4P0_GIBM7|nr:hypothetical protein FVEG_15974 [Fusarium verticillioides 7600]EWG46538.1 hypothetical protein FVEG_15974 [Fusarium verticillioides 7600]